VGLAVISFFMKWITRHSFLPFVVYRVAIGATIIVLLSMGVIQP
jgi:undecaprenyl-diphosphatase